MVGISVDDERRSRFFRKKLNLCFDLLCDVQRKVIQAYDVVDPQKRMGQTIALSADVIIDQHGEVIYCHKGSYKERPTVSEVLEAIGIVP